MKIVNKIKISLLVALFIIILVNIKSFAVTGVITEITINLREKPSTDSKKIMYVTQDDIVEVLEKDGDWYKIKFKGKIGYVFGKYVKVDDSKLETNTQQQDKEKKDESSKKEEVKESVKNEGTEKVNNTKNDVQDTTTDVPVDLQIKEKTDIKLIPNITSNIIYTSKKALSIEVIEQLNEWSYILVDNINGWVRTDRIIEKNGVSTENKKKDEATKKEDDKETKKEETTNSTSKQTKIAYIKYDTVNLRKKASTSSTVIAKLKLNDKVTVLEEVDSKWSKIKVDGTTGYVSTELLSDEIVKAETKETKKDENTTTSRDSQTTSREDQQKVEDKKEESKKENESNSRVTGSDIVAYAKKYLGYAYVYGGSTPKSGFDCSGFTKYVYNHFGYTISRSSKAQAKDGKEVSRDSLQPGDLIIFKNQSLTAIGHVGIYVGDNKIIHASEPGIGVTITDMNASGYNYNKRYVTARRIIN